MGGYFNLRNMWSNIYFLMIPIIVLVGVNIFWAMVECEFILVINYVLNYLSTSVVINFRDNTDVV